MPNRSRQPLSLTLLALFATACAGPGGQPTTPSAAAPNLTSTTSSTASPAGKPATVGAYEVHEWGVIDVPVVGAFEVGAGPGAPSVEPDFPRPVKKPVLYFHLDPGAGSLEVDVKASIPRGSMLEAWPAGEMSANAVRWSKVRVGGCPRPATSFAFPLDVVRASGWPTRDGFNEVFELPSYETADSACLNSGESAARLLFYRGSIPGTRLPIEIGRDDAGRVVVRATVGSGGLLLQTFAGGGGFTVPWPAAGTMTPLAEKPTESFDVGRLAQILEGEIISRGLTAAEARAFMNAWTTPFFGTKTAARVRNREGDATCAARVEGPPASLLYLMPDATVASIAELSLTPAPRVSKRVMVVRIALPD